MNLEEMEKEINELKEQLRLEVDMRITNTKTLNRILNDWTNRVKNNKEALRELYKLNPQLIINNQIIEKLDSKKLPEPIDCCLCKYYSFSDRSMLCVECRNNGYSKYKPKEKTEPEKDWTKEEWECPICKKTVFVGYTVHRHCFDSFNKELIEGFIKKLAKLPAQNIVDEHGDNNVVIDGCWISKLSEEYEAMLKK